MGQGPRPFNNSILEGIQTLSQGLSAAQQAQARQQQLGIEQQGQDIQNQKFQQENAPYQLTDEWINTQPPSMQPGLRAQKMAQDAKIQSQQSSPLINPGSVDPSAQRGLASAIYGAPSAAPSPYSSASGNSDLLKGINPGAGVSDALGQAFQERQQLQAQQQGNGGFAPTAPPPATISRRDYLDARENAQIQAQQELAKQNAAIHGDLLKSQINKNEATTDKTQTQADQLSGIGGVASGGTPQQQKTFGRVQQLLESARGNPAVQQAEKDLYSAQKADSLANLYGDPNKLALPQVRLLAAEVGKIAAGGVSTQSELEGITPNTLRGKLGQAATYLTNAPTAANAAAFVKQYQDYTGALSKDAQKVIDDKYGRVVESNKAQLGDANYKTLKSNYIDRFKNQQPAQPQQQQQFQRPQGLDDNTANAQARQALRAGAPRDAVLKRLNDMGVKGADQL